MSDKTPNLDKILDANFNIQEVNWSHPDNVKLLESARKEYVQLYTIIESLADYGPGIDLWEETEC